MRALRQRIDAEDVRYTATAHELLAPVRARIQRYPLRNLRPETLLELEQSRHTRLNSPHRLWCRGELTKHRLHIREAAISSAKLACASWDGGELSLIVAHGELTVGRGVCRFQYAIVAMFSLHALARRLQRGPVTSDDALLDDVALLDSHDAGEVREDEGFVVRTKDGRWLGRCMRIDTAPRVLAVRTWLPA